MHYIQKVLEISVVIMCEAHKSKQYSQEVSLTLLLSEAQQTEKIYILRFLMDITVTLHSIMLMLKYSGADAKNCKKSKNGLLYLGVWKLKPKVFAFCHLCV